MHLLNFKMSQDNCRCPYRIQETNLPPPSWCPSWRARLRTCVNAHTSSSRPLKLEPPSRSARGANKQHTVARCAFRDGPQHASVVTSEYLSYRCLSCHQPGCSPCDLGLRQSIFTPGSAPGWVLSAAPSSMSRSKSPFFPFPTSTLQ